MAQTLFNFGDAIVLFTTILLALLNVYAGRILRRLRREYNSPDRNDRRRYCSFRDGRCPRLPKNYSVANWFGTDRLLFCGTVGGAGVLLLWSRAVEHALAGRIAVFVTASPVSAAIVGPLVLCEPITLNFVSGAVLIVAGIYRCIRVDLERRFRSAFRP